MASLQAPASGLGFGSFAFEDQVRQEFGLAENVHLSRGIGQSTLAAAHRIFCA
jgi:hypothetical protein